MSSAPRAFGLPAGSTPRKAAIPSATRTHRADATERSGRTHQDEHEGDHSRDHESEHSHEHESEAPQPSPSTSPGHGDDDHGGDDD